MIHKTVWSNYYYYYYYYYYNNNNNTSKKGITRKFYCWIFERYSQWPSSVSVHIILKRSESRFQPASVNGLHYPQFHETVHHISVFFNARGPSCPPTVKIFGNLTLGVCTFYDVDRHDRFCQLDTRTWLTFSPRG